MKGEVTPFFNFLFSIFFSFLHYLFFCIFLYWLLSFSFITLNKIIGGKKGKDDKVCSGRSSFVELCFPLPCPIPLLKSHQFNGPGWGCSAGSWQRQSAQPTSAGGWRMAKGEASEGRAEEWPMVLEEQLPNWSSSEGYGRPMSGKTRVWGRQAGSWMAVDQPKDAACRQRRKIQPLKRKGKFPSR